MADTWRCFSEGLKNVEVQSECSHKGKRKLFIEEK